MNLGLIRYIVIGIAALALIVTLTITVRGCKKDAFNQENQSINLGEQKERAASQGEALNHVQKANNAVDAPTGEQLNVVCSKYDRNCAAAHGK